MKNHGEPIALESKVQVRDGLFLTQAHLCLILQRFTDQGESIEVGMPAVYFDTETADGKPGEQIGIGLRQGGVYAFTVHSVDKLPQQFATASFQAGGGVTFRGLPNPATPGRNWNISQSQVNALFIAGQKIIESDAGHLMAAYGMTEAGIAEGDENRSLSSAIRGALGLNAGIMANYRGAVRALRNGEAKNAEDAYLETRDARAAGTYQASGVPKSLDAFAPPPTDHIPF